ncbi:DMT family transporter [Carnimonas bestiolae]|uniref:DMT family transporter n=1 Tax=Carnimonas bestiolae TaxID=3402172 RepID=UPI003EDBBC36
MNAMWAPLAVTAAAVLWGTTGVVASAAPAVSPLTIGAVAMGVGGILQACLALGGIRQRCQLLLVHWRWWLVGAIAVAIYPLAFYSAMREAGVTIGNVVSIGAAPVCSALLERVLDGRRVSLRWKIGIVTGISGILVLGISRGGEATQGLPAGTQALWGMALGIVAAFTYALYSYSAQRLMRQGIGSRDAMGAIFGGGGILLLPLVIFTGASLLASWSSIAVGGYLALVPMFIGYLCFGYGLSRVAASTATTITLIEPVVAALLAAVVLGERLTPSGWLGIAMIFLCLLIVTVPMRLRSAPSASVSNG